MTLEPVLGNVFSWESQARQYAPTGNPGLSFEQHLLNCQTNEEVFVPPGLEGDAITVIDCLLHRDEDGVLDGILNHYDGKNPLEKRDAINVWVRPDRQREGIATALVREALLRWPAINYKQLRYSESGLALLESFLRRNEIAR